MQEQSLIAISFMAFASVFVLLSSLAVIMRMTMIVFPYDKSKDKSIKRKVSTSTEPIGSIDSVVVTAITSAIAAAKPGAKVTLIEEIL